MNISASSCCAQGLQRLAQCDDISLYEDLSIVHSENYRKI